jgi:transcriptional regulator with XRE-family HTH domain
MYHDGNKPPRVHPLGLYDNSTRASLLCAHGTFAMSPERLISYLRAHRKRSGLTQKELAFLVGIKSGTQLSRFERLKREPSAEMLIAFMIIFKKPPEELFPHTHDRIMKLVQEQTEQLHETLQGDTRLVVKAKLDTLEAVLRSAEDDNQTNYDQKTTL